MRLVWIDDVGESYDAEDDVEGIISDKVNRALDIITDHLRKRLGLSFVAADDLTRDARNEVVREGLEGLL